MGETPNHEYNVPVQGQENWHEPLNENFEQYDTDIEIRDQEANRGEYEPKAGAKYLATDTGAVFVGDGDTWNKEMVLGVTDGQGGIVFQPDGEDEDVSIQGNIEVSGTKHFVETVQTSEGTREVVYTAGESPTPRTEVSGVERLSDGRVEITLPDHFAMVTSNQEPLLVQTTPYAAESAGLAVVEQSLHRIVVEDRDGTGEYEFTYTVKGTRAGMEDQEVVRVPEQTQNYTPDERTEADD